MFKKMENDELVDVITGEGLKELMLIFFLGCPIYWMTIRRPLIRKKVSRSKLDLIIIAGTG